MSCPVLSFSEAQRRSSGRVTANPSVSFSSTSRMFDIRSQLMVGCGVTEQVEFAATVEHDQIARFANLSSLLSAV